MMITFSKRTAFHTSIIAFVIVVALPLQKLSAGPPNQEESAFAKRMMTMDRNKDGFLTPDELPKSLLQGIASADRNADGKWTAAELSVVSQKALNSRTKESAAASQSGPAGRRRNGSLRSRGGRGPSRPNSGVGSPLDAAQILKFALTFDLDKDGGLNKDELSRYASALAVRRSRARQQRETGSATSQNNQDQGASGRAIPLPESPDRPAPAKEASGLKSKSSSTDGDPFGSGKSNHPQPE